MLWSSYELNKAIHIAKNHTSFDPHYAKFKNAVMRSVRVKTKGILGRIDYSESTLTTSLHKCLAQTVEKPAVCPSSEV